MRWHVLALIVAASALPLAQAQSTAESLDLAGQQQHAGQSLAFALHGDEGGLLGAVVEADGAYMLKWEQPGVFVTCVVGPCNSTGQSLPTEEEAQRWPAEGVALDYAAELVAVEKQHQLNILPLGRALQIRADTQHTVWSSHDGVCLTQQGIGTTTSATCDGYREARSAYSRVSLGQVQVYASEGGVVHLRGDMVLEMRGLAWQGSESEFDTRQDQDAGPAGLYTRPFGRMVLFNATLELEVADGSDLGWAMQRGQAHAKDAVLTGVGSLEFGGRTIDLSAGDAVRGDFVIDSEAGDQGMPFTVRPASAAPAGQAPLPSSVGMAGLGLLGLLPVAGAVAVGLRHRDADMASVERALRAGRFRRAAHLSGRILRKQPMHESAQLSRAIALTKGGRPKAAIESVQSFLQRAEPNDGTLHFVMGMALLQIGRDEEARVAMGAAVQRTPSLLGEVAPTLRPHELEAGYT